MTFTANGKRQTAKMKLLPSLFSSMYSRVKLFVFVMNSRRRYSIFVCFIYGLEEKNSKSEVIFAVCRLRILFFGRFKRPKKIGTAKFFGVRFGVAHEATQQG